MISLGLSLSESFLVVGIDCMVLVNSSPFGSISLILACHAPSPFLGGLSQFIGFLIRSSNSHILLLRLMGMAPKNSTILLNTKVSLKGLSSASLSISHSLASALVFALASALASALALASTLASALASALALASASASVSASASALASVYTSALLNADVFWFCLYAPVWIASD
ncbi:hypothetical protein Tco_1495394 [Tanacetum coccineum]